MRPRWQEWVIVISLCVIGAIGVAAIWGGDLMRLVVEVSQSQPPEEKPEEKVEQPQPAQPPGGLPGGVPGGAPAGPF